MPGKDRKNRPPEEAAEHPSAEHARVKRPRTPAWKRAVFSLLAACAFLGLMELILALAGVRPIGYSEDPFVGFTSYSPLFVEARGNVATTLETAKGKRRWFGYQSFPREKPPGTYRIFCMGGSTTLGRPYDDRTSFSGWLRELLPVADPSRTWQVINAGAISYASYRVAVLMEKLIDYEPDLFIIYSGHNEFLERRTYGDILDKSVAEKHTRGTLARTRTYAFIKRMLDSAGKGKAGAQGPKSAKGLLGSEVKAVLDESVGPEGYTRDDKLARQVAAHYRLNLRRMVEIARSVGAKVIFVNPAGNLKDCSPFKSEHTPGLAKADIATCEAMLEEARTATKAGKNEQALAVLQQAAARDPRHAHTRYLLGQALWRLGRYDEAKEAFIRARDEDICPLRAVTQFGAAVADVAAARGVPLVDFTAIVEDRSPHATPGTELFLDHVHPTIEGNRLLAMALLDELAQRKIVTKASWDPAAIDAVKAKVAGSITDRDRGIALRNVAKVLAWAGKFEEAYTLAKRATQLAPDDAEAEYQLAGSAQNTGKPADAEKLYHAILAKEVDPKAVPYYYVESHYYLGELLAEQGKDPEATGHFHMALRINPRHERAKAKLDQTAAALMTLGNRYLLNGKTAEAVAYLEAALLARKDNLEAMNNLAWALVTCPRAQFRNAVRAVELASRACELTGHTKATCLDTLAAALAESGRFIEAAETAHRAAALARAAGEAKLAQDILARLKLYRAKKAYREPARK